MLLTKQADRGEWTAGTHRVRFADVTVIGRDFGRGAQTALRLGCWTLTPDARKVG